jgi:hypothetical protein
MASGDVNALFDETVLEDLGMTKDEMYNFLESWKAELEGAQQEYEKNVRDVGDIIAKRLMIKGIWKK